MKKTITITIFFLLLLIKGQSQTTPNTIKPYNEIITSKAITKKGFIKVHQLDDKLYFEIPEALLNKDLLFVKHNYYSDYKQVKWIKEGNNIHMIIPPVKSEVGNIIPSNGKNYKANLMAANFPILAEGSAGSTYVIDVTTLFLTPPKGLPGNGAVIVDGLAHIDKVLAIDNTIEVQTKKIITSEAGSQLVTVSFSMVLLPEPMMPRLWDLRMGFEKETGGNDIEVVRASITRWRLEKKYPDQPLSDPIKPITLYFSPSTPAKWKPYIKAGVEQWLPTFEAAGFKNAIVVKEPPMHDKNWSLNSTRYSYIRWIDNSDYRGKENAGTGSVSNIIDERSGEFIKADILFGNPCEAMADMYFVRCSPLDVRAQQYPFPDDLIGELIAFITAHEAGHFFGLKDGHYGEYAYPFEKMRDKTWLQGMGHTPSVMSYTRHNFIVQPEDSIPPQLLIQKVGPTDLYSIRWGYIPFEAASTPDEELPYLNTIAKEQDTISWYRYLPGNSMYIGPQGTNEVVESDDPIKATKLGMQNLKRVFQLIPLVTRNQRGNEVKKRLYKTSLDHWSNQMKSVVALIGGYTIQHKSTDQEGPEYVSVPANRQKEAVAFLNKEAFQPQLWLAPTDLIRSFDSGESNSLLNRSIYIITTRQLKILKDLFEGLRLKNLQEIDFTTQNNYPMAALFQDLSAGLFEELKAKDIKIDPYRQGIQMAYIIYLNERIAMEGKKLTGSFVVFNKYKSSNYIRGTMYNTLHALKNNIENTIIKVKDPTTKAHLKLCLLEINKTSNF